MTKTTSYLPRNQRSAHPRAQVASLQRIATRAASKAEHITELLEAPYSVYESREEREDAKREVNVLWAKADAVIQEMIMVAEASGERDLEAKARIARNRYAR